MVFAFASSEELSTPRFSALVPVHEARAGGRKGEREGTEETEETDGRREGVEAAPGGSERGPRRSHHRAREQRRAPSLQAVIFLVRPTKTRANKVCERALVRKKVEMECVRSPSGRIF